MFGFVYQKSHGISFNAVRVTRVSATFEQALRASDHDFSWECRTEAGALPASRLFQARSQTSRPSSFQSRFDESDALDVAPAPSVAPITAEELFCYFATQQQEEAYFVCGNIYRNNLFSRKPNYT